MVDPTLQSISCIEVKLDERCDGDPARYGVAVLQDGSSPDITRFLRNPICVTINAVQPYLVRLYYDEMVLEEKEGQPVGKQSWYTTEKRKYTLMIIVREQPASLRMCVCVCVCVH